MMCAALAQLVEREAVNLKVVGSIPTRSVGEPTVRVSRAKARETKSASVALGHVRFPLPFQRKVPLGWIIIHR